MTDFTRRRHVWRIDNRTGPATRYFSAFFAIFWSPWLGIGFAVWGCTATASVSEQVLRAMHFQVELP